MPRDLTSLIGRRVGRLIVHERVRKDNSGKNWYHRCVCDCGGEIVTIASNVRRGKTVSCGCQQKENYAKAHITHGHTRRGVPRSPEYSAWTGMRSRCNNPNNDSYEYYGGRGIQVCDRWLQSFENFFSDIGVRPSSNHSLDRVDVNGNYEPSNCKWATKAEQMINRRVHCARCGTEIFCPCCTENRG